MKISIVTTLYRSTPYIEEFYDRISKAVNKITDDYEIIFVNDGSPDDSVQKAFKIYEKDKKVKVIDLSRNFGHHKAAMTGLSYAKGEYIFMIDIDLEEDPELINRFWDELIKSEDVDAIYGILEERKGNWVKKFLGRFFYSIFNFLSDMKVPINFSFSHLLTRRYVNALLEFKEQEVFLGGIWSSVGFNQKSLIINKKSRDDTSYTFMKRLNLFVNAITSFSNKPLSYIFFIGSFMSFFSLLYVIYLITGKIFFNMGFTGYTTIVASIWLIGGIIIFCLGIIGIYLSKIFIETKNRPYSIVKKVYSR